MLLLLQGESKNFTIPNQGLLKLFSNGWEFLIKILHTNYVFLSSLNYLIYLFMLHLFSANGVTALSSSKQICSLQIIGFKTVY